MTKEEMTVLDEVMNAICDNYCKYPQIFSEHSMSLLKLCEKCPLNRLEELKEGDDD